ncbi:MAG TPA: hypothetical protein VHP11_09360 [Tepidisphaeraceae bacterium]|nr:hypothetical protein [Tepidisphaeraceae bacterium]
MTALPSTSDRVALHTNPQINEEIARQTEARVTYFSSHPEEIDRRLSELDVEWDIERALETNAASIALFGSFMGLLAGRKWFILPTVVSGFLLQHALQGWCPPVGLFRRMGIRTSREIENERAALKALRGDFKSAGETQEVRQINPRQVMEAVQR